MSIDKLIDLFREVEEYVWSKSIKPVKASTLADYYWCSRRSYLTFIFENSPNEVEDEAGVDLNELLVSNLRAVEEGSAFHGASYGFYVRVMEEPPREVAVAKALMGEVLPRNLETSFGVFQVQGAIDEIEVEDDGCVIRELKTTSRDRISKYSLAPARLQVKIYGWLISRYMPVKKLEIVFINRSSLKTLHEEVLEFNEVDVEREIMKIIRDYRLKSLKEPIKWKCDLCRLRDLCRRIFG